MAGICFYYEPYEVDVWSGKNLDAWNYACGVAGDIDSIVVVNKTDQVLTSPNADIDFNVVSQLPSFKGEVATYIVCPWDTGAAISLWDFKHRTDWYIFGPASGWKNEKINDGVYLPQDGMGACHSVHIATTVMMHRYGVKNGR